MSPDDMILNYSINIYYCVLLLNNIENKISCTLEMLIEITNSKQGRKEPMQVGRATTVTLE
jgi:hypothetical protein